MLMPKMQCNMNSEIAKKKSCDWKFHSKWQQAVGIESVNYKLIAPNFQKTCTYLNYCRKVS